ncbi:MAG TPA: hypothetical protein VM364_18535 [Vicinamibacterales bacterium]|nr:hypothetical protein [Vicinamibacterales bacterium]
MRYALSAVLGITLVACSSAPTVPIRAGDVCHRCGRVITDPKLGVQLITTEGQAQTFRTPACLAKYLQDHKGGVKAIYVTDYPSGRMLPVTGAMFVRATIDEQTGERDFFAYRSVGDAAARARDEFSAVVDWSTVRAVVAAAKKG